jgi:hypothetical protein
MRTIEVETVIDWMNRAAAENTRLEAKISPESYDSVDGLIVTITGVTGEVAHITFDEYVKAKAEFLRRLFADQRRSA